MTTAHNIQTETQRQ